MQLGTIQKRFEYSTVSACWSCNRAVCVTASLLPRNSTRDYRVSAETQIWFVWLGRAVKVTFKCYFSFESVITLVLLQAMPGNGMLIVVNESVHLSKLCRAELTEHNCSTLPPESPLLTLLSLAFKSNGTKLAPSDLSSQSRTVANFCSSPSPMWFLEWSTAKVQLLPINVFGTGGGHWWVRGYGILNRERRACILSWSSV